MSDSNTKSGSAKDLVCPLTARPCGELHRCAWWDEGKTVDEHGTRGPGQCVIQRIADVLRRKGGGKG